MGRAGRRTTLIASTVAVLVCVSVAPAAAWEMPLDEAFGNDGRVFVAPFGSLATDVVVEGGLIYTIGRDFYQEFPPKTFVTRTLSDGTPDTTFNADGTQRITPRGGRCYYSAVAVDAVSRVVGVTACSRGVTVFRLTASGELDASFSGDGLRSLAGRDEGSSSDPHVAVDASGHIVVAGTVDSGDATDTRVWRLTESGTLDVSFAGDGTRLVKRPGVDWFYTLSVDDQSRIVLTQGPKFKRSFVYRLSSQGRLDPTFSGDGVKQLKVDGRDVDVLAIDAESSATRITLAAGLGASEATIRLRGNGRPDRSYGQQGVVRVPCGCFPASAEVITGRALFAGRLNDGSYRITRVSSDGTHVGMVSGNLYPDRKGEGVIAVTLAGRKMFLAGQARATAFVALVD